MLTIQVEGLRQLFTNLISRGYTIIGPQIRDRAIVFDTLSQIEQLPHGWTDSQQVSQYTIKRRNDDAFFAYAIGPVSWKKFLLPPRVRLFSAKRNGKEFTVTSNTDDVALQIPPLAFIGVRSCDLHALARLDRVFMSGEYADPAYVANRKSAFLVAVDCLVPGGNCFCQSTGTGPVAESGFDLALTELLHDGTHAFIVRVGSERGKEVLEAIEGAETTAGETAWMDSARKAAASAMGRSVALEGIGERLMNAFEHPAWDEAAKRCLACANCTMVCPTCFCSTVEDTTNLSGDHAERWRRWDSCFSMDFARVAGGNIRPSTRARYRQWVMHKFAYWQDQFGSSGCVGCGRCITWCPAGIDITSQLVALTSASNSHAVK